MTKIVMISILCLFLGACGVKPGAPEGAEGHPRTYPDIQVDTYPRGGVSSTR